MICDSLLNDNGVLRDSNVIKYIPDQSIVKPNVGDKIRISAEEFERLSAAFFAELERKFLASRAALSFCSSKKILPNLKFFQESVEGFFPIDFRDQSIYSIYKSRTRWFLSGLELAGRMISSSGGEP
jgi:hypothetical protein